MEVRCADRLRKQQDDGYKASYAAPPAPAVYLGRQLHSTFCSLLRRRYLSGQLDFAVFDLAGQGGGRRQANRNKLSDPSTTQ